MTIAIIPARAGSKGIISKNLQKIDGTSLISRSIMAAQECKDISDIYVTTDSEEISREATMLHAKVINRPDSIAGDLSSSEEAILHAIHEISRRTIISPNILFLQCTSPFVSPSDLSNVAKAVSGDINSSFSAVTWHGFLWERNGLGINHNPLAPRQRRQEITNQFLETGAAYCMKTELFVKYKSRFIPSIKPVIIDAPSIEIDSPIDLRICQLIAHLFDKK